MELARTLYMSANLLKDRGDWEGALAGYNRAIEAHPGYAHALCNRGVVLAALGRSAEALQSYDQALKLDATDAIAHFNRGVLLQQLARWEEALASYDRAIAQDGGFFHAQFNRGNVLRELQRWDAALASYERASAIAPARPEPWFNRGVIQQRQGQGEAALASYDQAIALNPGLFQACFNRGNVLKDLKRYEAALASYDQAIAVKPDYAEAWSHRGAALQAMNDWEGALASYDRALAIRSDFAEAHSNRGMALHELRRLDEALASYDRAIALKKDFADAWYGKSLALLLRGDYTEGWRHYEWRWKHAARLFGGEPRVFDKPLWLGREDLKGRRILLHAEQGLGDTLQFCRFATLVATLGAEVFLEVQAPLVELLKSLAGVARIIAAGDPLPDVDYQCPLMSLPLALGITLPGIPATVPYLRADPARVALWQARLGPSKRGRIGLVWSGNALQGNDRNRSIRLAEFIPHLPREFAYVCLQKEIRAVDRVALAANPWIASHEAELADFSDTAALAATTDLVISVCTSTAHLAGALGLRTWTLLTYNADWRWLLDRSDTPWYPTMTLYRRTRTGDWSSVFQRVAAELRAM
jgi:tetratricopeptide (TPR) repeat protein